MPSHCELIKGPPNPPRGAHQSSWKWGGNTQPPTTTTTMDMSEPTVSPENLKDQIRPLRGDLCSDNSPLSTMHCIATKLTVIDNAQSINKPAAAMVDLLVFICTYCNS